MLSADLEARVVELETLVRAMTDEVRTRRLVVVDETGFERVVAGTNTREGWVHVFGKGEDACEVFLVASEASTVNTAEVGVWARENYAGHLTATADPEGPVHAELTLSDVYVGEEGEPVSGPSAVLTTNCLQVGDSCIAPRVVATYA